MKRLAIVFNVLLPAFTLLVIATDGPPTAAAYVVFTLLLLAVPVVTVFALVRPGGAGAGRFAAVLNVLLLGAVCWAIIDQYPHPEDPGVVPYTALALLTPILGFAAMIRRGPAAWRLSNAAAGGSSPLRRPRGTTDETR